MADEDPKATVLLVASDLSRATYLADALANSGFQVRHVTRGSEAISQSAMSLPDVAVIDPPLADMDVLFLCRYLSEGCDLPILVSATSGREIDIVRALEAGADDYLVMPVRALELAARLRAVVRRTGNRRSGRPLAGRLAAGDLEIRLDKHEVYRKGVLIELSPIEFRLLACLVREAGRVVSHPKLIAQVWGPEYIECRHYLRVYIRYLRSKLEDDPGNPKLIASEWGVGYRFQFDPPLALPQSHG